MKTLCQAIQEIMASLDTCINEASTNDKEIIYQFSILENSIAKIIGYALPRNIENALLFDRLSKQLITRASYQKQLELLKERVIFYSSIPHTTLTDKNVLNIVQIANDELKLIVYQFNKIEAEIKLAESVVADFVNKIYRPSLNTMNWQVNNYEISLASNNKSYPVITLEDVKATGPISVNKDYFVQLCQKAGLNHTVVDNKQGTIIHITFNKGL